MKALLERHQRGLGMDERAELGRRERLGDEVVRSAPHRLDGLLDRRVGRHDDDLGRVGARARGRHQIEAGAVVGAACQIGDDSRLCPKVTLYPRCRLGQRVTIHAGSVMTGPRKSNEYHWSNGSFSFGVYAKAEKPVGVDVIRAIAKAMEGQRLDDVEKSVEHAKGIELAHAEAARADR